MTTEATAPKTANPASPATPDTPPSPYSMAASVARHVQLRNLRLLAMGAELKAPLREALDVMTKGDVEAGLDWKTSHGLSADAHELTALADYTVRICPRSNSGHVLVIISAKYHLEYDVTEIPSDWDRTKMLEAFASVNGVYNSWPYLREMVQNACARMTLPPVILPVYRAQNPPQRQSDSKSQTTSATAQAAKG